MMHRTRSRLASRGLSGALSATLFTVTLVLALPVPAPAGPPPLPIPALSPPELSLVGTWVSQPRSNGDRLVVVLREERTAETYAVIADRQESSRTHCYWELVPSDNPAVFDVLLIEVASEYLVQVVDARWRPDRCLRLVSGALQTMDGLTFQRAPAGRSPGSLATGPGPRADD